MYGTEYTSLTLWYLVVLMHVRRLCWRPVSGCCVQFTTGHHQRVLVLHPYHPRLDTACLYQ